MCLDMFVFMSMFTVLLTNLVSLSLQQHFRIHVFLLLYFCLLALKITLLKILLLFFSCPIRPSPDMYATTSPFRGWCLFLLHMFFQLSPLIFPHYFVHSHSKQTIRYVPSTSNTYLNLLDFSLMIYFIWILLIYHYAHCHPHLLHMLHLFFMSG